MNPLELISIAIAGFLGIFAVIKFVFHLNGKLHQRLNNAKDDYRGKVAELTKEFNNERVSTAEKYVRHEEFRELKRTLEDHTKESNTKLDGITSALAEIKGAIKGIK